MILKADCFDGQFTPIPKIAIAELGGKVVLISEVNF